MTDQTHTSEQTPAPEMKRIETLDDFAYLIRRWHHNGMLQLDHLTDVPEGQSVTLQLKAEDEPEEVQLTGDLHKGFRAGIVVAMNIFAQLPFGGVAKPEDGAAAQE